MKLTKFSRSNIQNNRFGNVNKFYGSEYLNAVGDLEYTLIQLQQTKAQIDSYDNIILSLRNQINALGADANAEQKRLLQDKLSQNIAEQANYKRAYDALMIQRDTFDQERMARGQSRNLTNTGVGDSAPVAQTNVASTPRVRSRGLGLGTIAIVGLLAIIAYRLK